MLAIHLTRFGEPEQSLKVVDVPEPGAPAAGQALVQVEYAPLDHHDLLLAQGYGDSPDGLRSRSRNST
jgi:NADPH:quinone reductase-like Zn-dependent oxidoreductase